MLFGSLGYNRKDINIKKENVEIKPGECKKMERRKWLILKEPYWVCNKDGRIVEQKMKRTADATEA